MNYTFIIKSLFITALCLLALPLLAQFPPPPTASALPPGVPIDGGILTIIGAGVAYGIKRHRDSRKNK